MCTLLFGGSVKRFRKDTPAFVGELSAWWSSFAAEIKTLSKLVWRTAISRAERKQINDFHASPEYKDRHKDDIGLDGNVKIHPGKRLTMVLQKRETDVVLAAILELERREVSVESYQYDGFLVRATVREKVEQWMAECNTADAEFIVKPFSEPLVRPPFRRFDPLDFCVGLNIRADDVPGLRVECQARMEQYLFKTLTPAGFVFLPDGPASSNRDPRAERQIRSMFSNVYVPTVEEKKGKDGEEQVVGSEPYIQWWLGQPDMRQYNDMRFCPPPLPRTDGHYNTWRGFKIDEVASGADPVDVEPFIKHCTVLMEGNAEWGGFLLDLLAHRVQRPGERTELALVFLGSQGTGKTTFFQLICKGLLYTHNYLITEKAEQITGKFHQLAEKIVVLWEEAEGQDTHNAADRIKHLVTTESEWGEKKCKDATLQPMCFLPIVTANHVGRKSVNIEGTDRRWVVMRVDSAHVDDDPDYFAKLFADDGGMADRKFMRAVYDFLRARDISQYKNGRDWSRARPISETYTDLQHACKPPIRQWLDHVAQVLASGEGFDVDEAHLDVLAGGEAWSAEFSAKEIFPAYKAWRSKSGYEHGVMLSSFENELGGVANGPDGHWCKKIKTGKGGLRRYTVNAALMIKALVGSAP